LAQHTALDSILVMKLLFRLQVLPLSKQLTNISGNLWTRSIKGVRAERIEYLLLHEFHRLKYITPEKHAFSKKLAEDGKQATHKRGKASYSGGLVLEPKKGLYDSYILLLDFNSLYPSIIQEFNLCFTTVDWSKYMRNESDADKDKIGNTNKNSSKKKEEDEEQNVNENDLDVEEDEGNALDEMDTANENGNPTERLPPQPDSTLEEGILPRVIKTLVQRRRAVKGLLKDEKDPIKREQLDVKQLALKLTANSMYGCLGFSHSRFFARPIAAMVTAYGRDTLQRTVNTAQNVLQLDVIYGDTDSIMIHTNIASKDEEEDSLLPVLPNANEEGIDAASKQKILIERRAKYMQIEKEKLKKVRILGEKVKREVNKLYRTLELELDGIFKCMLLLKKKKYAALVVNEKKDGKVEYSKEMKGLDIVRRDWCVLSKEVGRYVLDQILSGENRDIVLANIFAYLEELSKKIRNSEISLDKFVITKGLNKRPNEYPDAKSQPHLQVALRMIDQGKPVNVGDHIPYIICQTNHSESNSQKNSKDKTSYAARAYHPNEVKKSQEEADKNRKSLQQEIPVLNIPTKIEMIGDDNDLNISNQNERDLQQKAQTKAEEKAEEELKVDIDWYMTQQILPPIARLCDPIEGANSAVLAERLGIDSKQFRNQVGMTVEEEDEWGFTPLCRMEDAERFQDCSRFKVTCLKCKTTTEFPGVYQKVAIDAGRTQVNSGLTCPTCSAKFWGSATEASCFARLSNLIILSVRKHVKQYYDGWLICDDSSCNRRTQQQSVLDARCTTTGCKGRMHPEYSEAALHAQIKYFSTLFDVKRAQDRWGKSKAEVMAMEISKAVDAEVKSNSSYLPPRMSITEEQVFDLLSEQLERTIESSAYNWIRPSLWTALFRRKGKNSGTKKIHHQNNRKQSISQ